MVLAPKLQLRQSQALVMTPQLLQSIRLLQYTQAELDRFVDEEIERNPLLERAEAREETLEAAAAPGEDAVGDGDWFVPSWQSIVVIGYITLVPMSIGNVSWFAIVGLLPTNVAGLSSIMVPVVAMVSGAIVHGEPLGPLQWAAMTCCAAALSLALMKPGRGSMSVEEAQR